MKNNPNQKHINRSIIPKDVFSYEVWSNAGSIPNVNESQQNTNKPQIDGFNSK